MQRQSTIEIMHSVDKLVGNESCGKLFKLLKYSIILKVSSPCSPQSLFSSGELIYSIDEKFCRNVSRRFCHNE